MARNDRKSPGSGSKTAENRSDTRQPRSIRFSDSEWTLIEGPPRGKTFRPASSGAVAAAEDRLGESPPATLSAGHAALIEAIYRSVYVMVTLKRQELLDDERGEELDDLVAAAHRTMTETMNEGPA